MAYLYKKPTAKYLCSIQCFTDVSDEIYSLETLFSNKSEMKPEYKVGRAAGSANELMENAF